MAFHKCLFTNLLILSILLISSTSQVAEASRPLDIGEQWLKKQVPVHASLARGPVPPSSSSPCTYIPGGGSGTCTLNGRNFAGRVVAHAPPAYPGAVVKFAVAIDSNNQEPSS